MIEQILREHGAYTPALERALSTAVGDLLTEAIDKFVQSHVHQELKDRGARYDMDNAKRDGQFYGGG